MTAKLRISKGMLNKPKQIIAKGIINGKKVVAVTGQIGDWAGYYESDIEQTFDQVAELGHKIYSSEIGEFFSFNKQVKEKYRR